MVDNASQDATRARVRELIERRPAPPIRLIANEGNLGFSRGCNIGIAKSTGAGSGAGFVVLLNPDCQVSAGWLETLLAPLERDVAATGPLSNYVAGKQKAELHLARIPTKAPSDWRELAAALARHNAGRTVETKLLIGFCLALRRDLLEKHGALDEALFLGNDDLEYSHRMRGHGYRLLVATDCFVHHHGQRSFASLAKTTRDRLVQESTDALQRKLEAIYGDGRVPSPMDLWDIEWFRPTPKPAMVSIVVPVWNNVGFTRACLKSIATYTPEPHEVIVVDNGSTDGTPAYLASVPRLRVIRNETNLGFAAAL